MNARRPKDAPAGTCDWGDCDKPAIAWRRNGSRQLGEYLPVCADHVEPADDLPDYQTPTGDVPPPAHGSPAWHLDEAERHLGAADGFARQHATDLAAGRMLAAIANAQIGALKAALELDELMREALGQLRQLSTSTEFVAGEVDRLDLPRRG